MNVVLKTLQIFLSWPLTFKNASIHPPSFRPEVHGPHTRLSIQLYCLTESHQEHVTLEKPLFPHVWLRVAICALQNERERNNLYLVELFLRRLLSPKHHYYNPKTEPGKSKRSYKKALISESSLWAWTLLRLSSLLFDCGQWASCEPWLICSCWENTGFHVTPSTALHCSPLSCSVLLKCAWLNSAPFSRRHGLLSALAIYYRILSSSGSVRYSSGQSSWLVLPFLA